MGNYHTFVMEKIGAITDKPFYFCFTNSDSLVAINLPTEQAKTKPSSLSNIKNNLIFDVHPILPLFLQWNSIKQYLY